MKSRELILKNFLLSCSLIFFLAPGIFADKDSVNILIEKATKIQFKINGAHYVQIPSYIWKNHQTKEYVVYITPGNQIVLKDRYTDKVFFFKNQFQLEFALTDPNGYLEIKNKKYPGFFYFIAGRELQLITMLSVEDYLFGVVTGEMGSRNKKYEEALKAQAVASRTYFYYTQTKKKRSMKATPSHQYYLYQPEFSDEIKTAVQETRGEIITYQDKPILSVFSADCGGHSASSFEAWGRQALPYLKSNWDGLGLGDELCSHAKRHFWVYTYNSSQLNQICRKKIFDSPNEIFKYIEIRERTPSGRIKEIIFKSDKKNYSVTYEKIRTLFSCEQYPGGLPSRLFSIYYFYTGARIDYIKIAGVGFGHGAGLCQHGALKLSEMGFNYKQILAFYYPKTQIKKMIKRRSE